MSQPPPPPQQPNQPQAPVPPPPGWSLKVRYNPGFGVLFVVVGALLVVTGLINARFNLFLGVLMLILGVLYMVGTAVIVEPNRLRVKSVAQITNKDVPIHGPGDLILDDKKRLYRAGDGKKLASLGFASVRSGDLDALRQAISAAGGGQQHR